MAGRLLLDTNVVISLFAQETALQEALAQATEVFVPSMVLGELYFGANRSVRPAENIAKIHELAARSSVLACDAQTALVYGDIKNRLRIKGRPIPENDIWIAAIAVQHGLTLVTRDAHFSEVEGLLTEAP